MSQVANVVDCSRGGAPYGTRLLPLGPKPYRHVYRDAVE